jgi:alcohol dehydrogenase class IV
MKKENLDEAAPHIILPTIAGCGAEISPNSLVLDEDSESKSSFSPIPINAEVRCRYSHACVKKC